MQTRYTIYTGAFEFIISLNSHTIYTYQFYFTKKYNERKYVNLVQITHTK